MGHSHDLPGGWDAYGDNRVVRLVLGALAAAAAVTFIALIALWPSGDGQRTAIATATDLGLASERLSATVSTSTDAECSYSTPETPQTCRTFELIVDDGAATPTRVVLPELNLTTDPSTPDLDVGDRIIVGFEPSTGFYFYADRERRGTLLLLAVVFAAVVVGFGRTRGVAALGAMAVTVFVLVVFVAPSVLDGNNALLVAVTAASLIAFISLIATHGPTPATVVALAGTLAALGLTLALSWLFFELAKFTGLATEEALTLPIIADQLDMRSLLLAGAVIGALGALDDVTVTQVATVAELRHRSPTLPTSELIASGIRVGRHHIASTVNTLLLAYVGASLPLVLLFAASNQSLSMVANSELIAVEIVRTLCGSIGLVAAVPITTALAAAVLRPPGRPSGRPPVHPPEGAPSEPSVGGGEI